MYIDKMQKTLDISHAKNITDITSTPKLFISQPFPHDCLLYQIYYRTGSVAMVRYNKRLYKVRKVRNYEGVIYALPDLEEYRKDFSWKEAERFLKKIESKWQWMRVTDLETRNNTDIGATCVEIVKNIATRAYPGSFLFRVHPHNSLLCQTLYKQGVMSLVRCDGRLFRVHKVANTEATVYSYPDYEKYQKSFSWAEAKKFLEITDGWQRVLVEKHPSSELKIDWIQINSPFKTKPADIMSAKQKGTCTMIVKLYAVTIVKRRDPASKMDSLGIYENIIPVTFTAADAGHGKTVRDAAIVANIAAIEAAGGLDKVKITVHALEAETL